MHRCLARFYHFIRICNRLGRSEQTSHLIHLSSGLPNKNTYIAINHKDKNAVFHITGIFHIRFIISYKI